MAGGWFCKTHNEWFDEIRIKRHSVRRFAKEFSERGFLKVKLKKFNGAPKPHYLLDDDELINQLVTFCDSNKLLPLQKVTLEGNNLQPSMEGNNLQPSINIDLQRINTESSAQENELDGLISDPEDLKDRCIVECNGEQIWPPKQEESQPSTSSESSPEHPILDWETEEDLQNWEQEKEVTPLSVAQEMARFYEEDGYGQRLWKSMCDTTGYNQPPFNICIVWAGKQAKNPDVLRDWENYTATLTTWMKNEVRTDQRHENAKSKYKRNVSSSPQPEKKIISEQTNREAFARTVAEMGF